MIKHKAVIFDFDGTLVDSAPGIILSLKLMLEGMGRPPATEETLRACVGPPFHQFLPQMLDIHGADVESAFTLYRRLFDEHALPALKAYPGIHALLSDIKAAGLLTGIATCKLRATCIAQADMLHLTQHIDYISGANPDLGIFEKADVLKATLDALEIAPEDALMVGDRVYDLIGANETGADCVGVLYGGCETREEMRRHHPLAIVKTVEDLRAFILG